VRGSEKSLFLWSGGSEKNRLFTADVQNDAHSPSRMHAVVLSIDQRLVDDALWNAPVNNSDVENALFMSFHFRAK